MNVPIFDSGSIVVVAGVGNKTTEYDANDVIQVTILINFLWSIIKHKKANDTLRGSLEEKEVLLREIHHRVKNNLQIISSLLNLQADTIENEEAKKALKESKNRVRSIAMIHGKLYRSKDLSKIDFSEYVKGLTSDILRTYTSSSNLINLNHELDHFLLKIETAMPLGLIINEMVTNSVKHAFKPGSEGEISVKLVSEGETMLLTVRDNGIGFPRDLDARYTKTLGLRLVYSLVNQINGEIELNRSNGTEFKIRFYDN
jgi:two-component sensor histidine kinase